MDVNKLFNGFAKACTIINRVYTEPTILSNGVFIWMDSGCLSVLTFNEKMEKPILPILDFKMEIDQNAIVFMDKFFKIKDIYVKDRKMYFEFDGDFNKEAFDNKSAETVIPMLERGDNNSLILKFPIITNNHPRYVQYSDIIKDIYETADFDKSVIIEDIDKQALMKDDRPIMLEKDGYSVRIAKSVFQSIVAKDDLEFRCTPYKDKDSIFLSTATVSKEHCKLVTMFNVLKI